MVGDCLRRIASSPRLRTRNGLPRAMSCTLRSFFGISCRPTMRFLLAIVGTLSLAATLRADPSPPLHERIDALLRQVAAGAPSPVCTDAEFLRRLSADLLGSLPTAD